MVIHGLVTLTDVDFIDEPETPIPTESENRMSSMRHSSSKKSMKVKKQKGEISKK